MGLQASAIARSGLPKCPAADGRPHRLPAQRPTLQLGEQRLPEPFAKVDSSGSCLKCRTRPPPQQPGLTAARRRRRPWVCLAHKCTVPESAANRVRDDRAECSAASWPCRCIPLPSCCRCQPRRPAWRTRSSSRCLQQRRRRLMWGPACRRRGQMQMQRRRRTWGLRCPSPRSARWVLPPLAAFVAAAAAARGPQRRSAAGGPRAFRYRALQEELHLSSYFLSRCWTTSSSTWRRCRWRRCTKSRTCTVTRVGAPEGFLGGTRELDCC